MTDISRSQHSSLLDTLQKDHLKNELLKSRTLILSGGVNSQVAENLIESFYVLNHQNHEPIKLIINSPGGEVNSGMAIYDTIKFISSEVVVLNSGLCASIATIINCAVKPQHRYSLPHTKFLIHQPLIMGHIQGQASDLEIQAQDILKTRELLNRILAESCDQKQSKVEKDTMRDYWMNAKEALQYGLITQIVDAETQFKL